MTIRPSIWRSPSAEIFLQRAHQAIDPDGDTRWAELAGKIYEGPYKSEFNDASWKDYSAGNFGKLGAYNMVRLLPREEKYHRELMQYCNGFCNYEQTHGGLRLREWHAHEYGSLRHANNAAVIALYYSGLVERRPELNYLESVDGKNTLVGQQGVGEAEEAFEASGKWPAMFGSDLCGWHKQRWSAQYQRIVQSAIDRAKQWHDKGGIERSTTVSTV